MRNITSVWTEQRIDDLRLFLKSGLSYSEIAEKIGFGVTRNSVSGKVDRLGLTSHRVPGGYNTTKRSPEEIEETKRLKNERRRERRRAIRVISGPIRRPRPRPSAICEEIVPRHLTLLELERHNCRWPYGQGPYTFCGLDRYDESPYCAGHCLVSMRNAERD